MMSSFVSLVSASKGVESLLMSSLCFVWLITSRYDILCLVLAVLLQETDVEVSLPVMTVAMHLPARYDTLQSRRSLPRPF